MHSTAESAELLQFVQLGQSNVPEAETVCSLSAQCPMTLDHGAPVEATVFLPGGSLLATAGGTEIRSAQWHP